MDDIAGLFPHARVVGCPVAGFYFPVYPYTGPGHTNSVLAPFYPDALQARDSRMEACRVCLPKTACGRCFHTDTVQA